MTRVIHYGITNMKGKLDVFDFRKQERNNQNFCVSKIL